MCSLPDPRLGVYKLAHPSESGDLTMVYIQSGARYTLFNVKAPGSCLDLSGDDNRSSTSDVAFVYCFAQLTLAVIGFPLHNGANQQVVVICILQ